MGRIKKSKKYQEQQDVDKKTKKPNPLIIQTYRREKN